MKTYILHKVEIPTELLQRPVQDHDTLERKVKPIMAAVKKNGDRAVREFSKRFDGYMSDILELSQEELKVAEKEISTSLKQAFDKARENIYRFHKSQQILEKPVETTPGVWCWRKSIAIEKVGLYIPGGTAPLFSTVLMLGIPAKLAGCKEIVLCTPPGKDGSIAPEIRYAAELIGITKIFKVGGVQAIAAMAYGTESIPRVYKIFGPGNQYVTMAKTLAQKEGVAIDMPAGPSELLVLADETAEPAFVAADLLSQAEHGTDSQVLLVTTSEELIEGVQKELDIQLSALPRKETAAAALKNSKAIWVSTKEEAIDIVNRYAPEHLMICSDQEDFYVSNLRNAGSVFLGNYSPESAGDYASGTNHTLPTNGYAKTSGGLSLDAFVKKISFQKLSKKGIKNLADTITLMAEAEQLQAHKNAVTIRLKTLKK